MSEPVEILKVLVGSYAHGLETEESDRDYKGVYVTPTADFFKLSGGKVHGTTWMEGETEDNTAYEIGHFLHLATKCNPTILEVFAAPGVEETELGLELRALFPHIWNSRDVLNAFVGYSKNQQKKLMDDKYDTRDRKWKYAVAYLRVLLQANRLLRTGEMVVRVPSEWRPKLRDVRAGKLSEGQVIDLANQLRTGAYEAYDTQPGKQANLEPVQDFLLKVRRLYW